MCDDILKQAVEGISDLITTTGIINVDFADVRTIMQNAGSALMGSARRSAKSAPRAAPARRSIPRCSSFDPWRERCLVLGRRRRRPRHARDPGCGQRHHRSDRSGCEGIFGAVTDETLKKGQIRVTVVATGFPELPNVRSNATISPVPSAVINSKKEPEVQPATHA